MAWYKKTPNLIGVLRKKTEKIDKSFEKVISHMIKKVFLFLKDIKPKIR